MKRLCFLVPLLLAAALLPSDRAFSEPPRKERTPMQRKLDHSQKVLEGLALNDFGLIAKHAEELIDISKSAEWRALNKPMYELLSSDFRRTADNLVRSAKDKNLDGAALSYVELTLTCVKCHKYVREVRMVRLDDKPE
jgi:hypothetical protein